MKLLVVFTLILAATQAFNLENEWENFKIKYERNFNTVEEVKYSVVPRFIYYLISLLNIISCITIAYKNFLIACEEANLC